LSAATLCAAKRVRSTPAPLGTMYTSYVLSPLSFELQKMRRCLSPGEIEGWDGAFGPTSAKFTCSEPVVSVCAPNSPCVLRRTQKSSVYGDAAVVVLFWHPPARSLRSNSPATGCRVTVVDWRFCGGCVSF